MSRPTLDVSGLSASPYDSRSPAWWGNTLFMAIETTTVGLLLASYFYLWRNFPQSLWPPPRVDVDPPIQHPVPDLGLATVTTALLVATMPLVAWLNRACGRQFNQLERLQSSKPLDVPADVPEGERPEMRPRGVMLTLVAMTLLTALATFLR